TTIKLTSSRTSVASSAPPPPPSRASPLRSICGVAEGALPLPGRPTAEARRADPVLALLDVRGSPATENGDTLAGCAPGGCHSAALGAQATVGQAGRLGEAPPHPRQVTRRRR